MHEFQSFNNPVNEAILDIEKEDYENAFNRLKESIDFWLSEKSNKIKACHALKKIGLRMQSKRILGALETENFELLLTITFEELQLEKKEAIKNVFLKHNIPQKEKVEPVEKPNEAFAFPVMPGNANIANKQNTSNFSEALSLEKEPLSIKVDTPDILENNDNKEVIKNKKYTYFLSLLVEVEDESKQANSIRQSMPTRMLFKSDYPINTFKGIEELSKKMQNKKWALLSFLEIME